MIRLILVLIFTGALHAAPPQHLGPILTLDNGVAAVEVATTLGRITGFHRPGETDWIQIFDEPASPEIDYKPWGGDRIWPLLIQFAPQAYGGPNFDLAIETGPWTVTNSGPHFVELRSPDSGPLALRIIRRIELSTGRAEVIHRTRLERFADNPFPVQVWSVTSIPACDAVFMERRDQVRQNDGTAFKRWPHAFTEEPSVRLLARDRVLRVAFAREKIKAGTYGAWIAVTRKNSAFLQTAAYESSAFYPDESSLQFYSETARAYHELETLSPSWHLRAGEHRDWTVRWTLLDFPGGTATDEQRAGRLASLATEPLP